MLQPIVITGCRRSGTTLLTAMLTQHPRLIVHPKEPQFILEGYNRFGDSINQISQAVKYVTSHPYCSEHVTGKFLDLALHNRKTISYREFVRSYLECWGGDALETRVPVLKDPAFIYSLDQVAEILPGARIIHMIRDPRGNISSQLARWRSARLWECLRWWKGAIKAGLSWGHSHPDGYFELQYEELVENPVPSTVRLFDFLQEAYTEDILAFDLQAKKYSPYRSPTPVKYRSVDSSRLKVWQNQLSPSEIAIIEKQTVDEAAYWRFPPMSPPVSPLHLGARTIFEHSYDVGLRAGRWAKGIRRSMAWWKYSQ